MKKVLFATAGFVFVCLVLAVSFIVFGRSDEIPEGWRRVEVVWPAQMPERRPIPEPVFMPVIEKNGVSIQIEVFSGASSDHAHFHVSEQLTGQSIMGFRGPAETSFMDEQQPPLVKDLFAIKGVAEIHLYPYKISIEKGQRFDWDKLGPQIAEAIFKNIKKS